MADFQKPLFEDGCV